MEGLVKMSLEIEAVKRIMGNIQEQMHLLGMYITNARNQGEADEMYRIIETEINEVFASNIWDYEVDWDKVKWEST